MVKDGQLTPDGYAVSTSRSVYLRAPSDTDQSKLVPPQTMLHIGDRLHGPAALSGTQQPTSFRDIEVCNTAAGNTGVLPLSLLHRLPRPPRRLPLHLLRQPQPAISVTFRMPFRPQVSPDRSST
jgi:hypothetical protein